MFDISEDWLHVAWTQLWQVSLLIIAVVLVRIVLRRRHPHLCSVVWLVVLVKCVTPPLWSSHSSIFCWLQPPRVVAAESLTENLASQTVEFANVATDAPRADRLYELASPPALETGEIESVEAIALLNQPSVVIASGEATVPNADTIQIQSSPRTVTTYLVTIWMLGFVVYGLIATTRFMQCLCRILRARCVADTNLSNAAERISNELGLRQPPRIIVTSSQNGPAVIGLIRPSIVLPVAITSNGHLKNNLDAILAHELTHIRRGDLWLSALQTIVQAIWWFHPFVWIANRMISRDVELCCDRQAIARMGYRTADYARCLLQLVESKQFPAAVSSYPGVRFMNITTDRIQSILATDSKCLRRTPVWCWLMALAAAGVTLPGAALAIKFEVNQPQIKEQTKQLAAEQPTTTQPSEELRRQALMQVLADWKASENRNLTTGCIILKEMIACNGVQMTMDEFAKLDEATQQKIGPNLRDTFYTYYSRQCTPQQTLELVNHPPEYLQHVGIEDYYLMELTTGLFGKKNDPSVTDAALAIALKVKDSFAKKPDVHRILTERLDRIIAACARRYANQGDYEQATQVAEAYMRDPEQLQLSIIRMLVHRHELEKALARIDEHPSFSFRKTALRIVISALMKNRRYGQVFQVIKRLHDYSPNDAIEVATRLSRDFLEDDQIFGARRAAALAAKIIESMPVHHRDDQMRSQIATALFRVSDLPRGFKFVNEITDPKLYQESFFPLLELRMFDADRWRANELIEHVNQIRSKEIRLRVLIRLASLLLNRKRLFEDQEQQDIEKAKPIVAELIEQLEQTRSQNELADEKLDRIISDAALLFVPLGEYNKGERLLSWLDDRNKYQQTYIRRKALQHCRLGEFEKALNTIGRVPEIRRSTLTAIATELARQSEMEYAVSIHGRITDPEKRLDSLRSLIRNFYFRDAISTGRLTFDDGAELIRELRRQFPEEAAQLTGMEGLLYSGMEQFDDAQKLRRYEQVSKIVPESLVNIDNLAVQYAVVGAMEQAMVQAQRYMKATGGRQPDRIYYELVRRNRIDEATQFAMQFKDQKDQQRALQQLVIAIAKRGEIQTGMELIKKLEIPDRSKSELVFKLASTKPNR